MIPFTESLRYEYPLTPDSVVIDGGVYEGNFSLILHQKYGCKIIGFEPIKVFCDNSRARLKKFYPKVQVYQFGLGAENRQAPFHIKGDQTGLFAGSDSVEFVQLRAICDVLAQTGPVDVLKLNIEGAEFEVLESLLAEGVANLARNIQVQFHPVVPDFQKRHDDIRAALLKTHELTWDAPWCWANYELRKP